MPRTNAEGRDSVSADENRDGMARILKHNRKDFPPKRLINEKGAKIMGKETKILPEPQFARENTILLDGEWEFSSEEVSGKIRVPYSPESVLSGIGYTGFLHECVYRREFEWHDRPQKRIFLHFGAVSNRARVFVNGTFAGMHRGGYTPFSFEITKILKEGKNLLEVQVRNDLSERNPTGKQSPKEQSFGCFYTRCTGIWQSVWLEIVPQNYLKSVRFYPDAAQGCVKMSVCTQGKGNLSVEVRFGEKTVGTYSGNADYADTFTVELSEKHLWKIGQGDLYDVILRFEEDEVRSYFGLREVRYDGYRFLLNGEPVFQRLVLDQGYYPGGVYTPSRDTDFAADIERAVSLGFNGARLHQKLFDPRYLYECDRRGFMVWGEYASWGVDYSDLSGFGEFVSEWSEAVERDFNRPSIVVWCPLNETWGELDNPAKTRDLRFVDGVYAVTKALDPTRPCVDVSGGMHGTKTDIADFHCYDGYSVLKKRMDELVAGRADFMCMYLPSEGISYAGEPQHLSEFGGVTFGGGRINQTQCVQEQTAWGYDSIADEKQFVENYCKTVQLLFSYKKLSGFCYTQLYDIEQEQNGLFRYDRTPKFSEESMRRLCEANRTTAEIEKE